MVSKNSSPAFSFITFFISFHQISSQFYSQFRGLSYSFPWTLLSQFLHYFYFFHLLYSGFGNHISDLLFHIVDLLFNGEFFNVHGSLLSSLSIHSFQTFLWLKLFTILSLTSSSWSLFFYWAALSLSNSSFSAKASNFISFVKASTAKLVTSPEKLLFYLFIYSQ